ncbi:MAG TPA: hypothetical protein VK745_00235 [Polyangiaceae bacterium]|nr:hypothetical protein [Polyangiaceae bacterium]
MLIRPVTIGFWAALVLANSLRAAVASAAPAPAATSADESDDSDADKPADKPTAKPSTEKTTPDDAPPSAAKPPPAELAAATPPDDDSPLTFHSQGWTAAIYGFAELDIMADSSQSFIEGSLSNTLARPNTVAGDNPRVQFTARNSRLGFKIGAPDWNSIKTSAVVEMDFFGDEAATDRQDSAYTAGPIRMRHYYAKLESPVIDVLAGQYHDLFAWGGAGFYPNSVAFLPLMGEVYHRNPQLRLSKTFRSNAADFEIAVAAVRPVQRDAAVPDVQGGLRLAINGWRGASAPGASRPVSAPAALGVSAVGRRLSVTDFSPTPANPQTGTAWGMAANAFLPIIPAAGSDLSNALSVTGELTVGSGISDLYPGLTGGVGFPALPNPNNLEAVPTYTPNIDPGIVTFDANNRLQPIKWTALVLNAHYHLPIADGKKLWISGTYSLVKSSNALALTPTQGRAFVWDNGQYLDANLWWGVTPAAQVGLSFERTQQTFGDGTVAHNDRGEGAFYFFF